MSTRAASPDVSVDELAAERRPRPVLARGRDDVDVALEEERRALSRCREGARRDSAAPDLLHRVRLSTPASSSRLADELDALGFVPGRVRRVEPDQALEELDGSQ